MIIKAKYNKEDSIPNDIRHYAFEGVDGQLPLTIGNDYVVAGVRYTHGHEFYLIVSDDGRLCCRPWWYPKELFQVIDAETPKDWRWGGDEADKVHTFPELADHYTYGEANFQSQLEDGEDPALSIFKKYYDLYTQGRRR